VPPSKRAPQADALFERLSRVNPQADEVPDTLRLPLDAESTVNVGPFPRKGKSRTKTEVAGPYDRVRP